MSYFSFKAIGEISSQIFSHPILKSFVGIILYVWSYLFGKGDIFSSIAVPIVLLLILDAATKIALSIKEKEVCPSIGRACLSKLFVYCAYIVMGRIVDHDIPGDIATWAFRSFIIGTECLAVTETLGKLGFPLPPRFLKYFKAFTDDGKDISKVTNTQNPSK